MSHYLSDIAARSIARDTHALLPVTPAHNSTDTGKAGNFAVENSEPDSNGQNEFVQQTIVPVLPIMVQKIQPTVITNTNENALTEKNIQPSYLSKHIERVEVDEENSQLKDNSSKPSSFKVEEPSQKPSVESLDAVNNANETIFVNKKFSKIIPEKRSLNKSSVDKKYMTPADKVYTDAVVTVKNQMIKPSVKEEVKKQNKLEPNNSLIERINPIQSDTENTKQVQRNNTNQPVPKLVIGKIIVQILPPLKTVPQKVINRVVQSSSNNNNSKSNKLIFGLGQL